MKPLQFDPTKNNRIAAIQPEVAAWRQDLHAHPEVGFEEVRTAGIVADKLREFGVDEVIEGIARTGIVGIIRGRGEGPMIGLRADMDALPMQERGERPHRSTIDGKMHACGHDGHTAMLLGAAKLLCERRDFAGSVAVIFQPAEEGGGGGRVMVEEGLFEHAPCDSVWGLHNFPGLPLGSFAALEGGTMAGIDYFDIAIRGQGGHAGVPHEATDTVLAAAHLVTAIPSISARSIAPTDTVTIGVAKLRGADAHVIMPEVASIGGSIRWFREEARELAERRLRKLAARVAEGFDCEAVVDYRRLYPATINPPEEAALAAEAAAALVGAERVMRAHEPCMAGEDFSFMLNERPGHYIWLGVDAPDHVSGRLHYPDYDFNDAAIAYGVGYWLSLVARVLSRAA
jgi:amidohydrolase